MKLYIYQQTSHITEPIVEPKIRSKFNKVFVYIYIYIYIKKTKWQRNKEMIENDKKNRINEWEWKNEKLIKWQKWWY